ncbi:hypothetical protein PoB_003685100, partial [Plakobranchus ocellatus]
ATRIRRAGHTGCSPEKKCNAVPCSCSTGMPTSCEDWRCRHPTSSSAHATSPTLSATTEHCASRCLS